MAARLYSHSLQTATRQQHPSIRASLASLATNALAAATIIATTTLAAPFAVAALATATFATISCAASWLPEDLEQSTEHDRACTAC